MPVLRTRDLLSRFRIPEFFHPGSYVHEQVLRVAQFHKDNIKRILKIMEKNVTKKGTGSEIRKKSRG
jgi:hypothetical protein